MANEWDVSMRILYVLIGHCGMNVKMLVFLRHSPRVVYLSTKNVCLSLMKVLKFRRATVLLF